MRYLIAVAMTFVALMAGRAGSLGWEKAPFVFAKEKRSAASTWSKESTLTDEGLVPSKVGEFWLQTDKMPAGKAWRPPTAAHVSLSIDAMNIPNTLNVFVRYGCDGTHWSTWQIMAESKAKDDSKLPSYECKLQIPSVAQARFTELYYAWLKTKPNWSSDKDALCRWIAQEHPRFFEKEIPVIGYLQFRLEDYNGNRSMLLRKLVVDASWGVGGLHSVPKQGKPDYSKKWWFEGKP